MRSPELPSSTTQHRVRRLALLGFAGVALMLLVLALRPDSTQRFVVSVGPWTGFEPLILLRERDGLPPGMRVIELASTTDTQVALQDRRVDAAAVALDEALRLRELMPDLQVVAVLSESSGADGILLRRGLTGERSLKGRSVLVEDTAGGRLMLSAALHAQGLDESEIRPVRVRSSQLIQLWNEGVGDALVCYQPLLARQQADGHELLLGTSELRGLVFDVLVVRHSVILERPEALADLLSAWRRGLSSLGRDEDEAVDLLRPGSGLDRAQYRKALSGLQLYDLRSSLDQLEDPQSALHKVLPALRGLLPAAGPGSLGTDAAALLAPQPLRDLIDAEAG